jgi:hypothetical protein
MFNIPFVVGRKEKGMKPTKSQVAVYYFPNWHPNTLNFDVLGVKESEWPAVQKARPRFAGHQQPKVPVWGYEDESDPLVMAKKIDAAADHGIDAFIFDWYWWENGPSLQDCLENGYLKAANSQRVKFGIMWANHRPVSRAAFDQAVDHMVGEYFTHPAYWKIDGKPYVSIYELYTLLKGLENETEVCRAIESLREKTLRAGFPGLHFNLVEWGLRNMSDPSFANQNRLLKMLGADSVTDYVWVHHAATPNFPENAYSEVAERVYADWDRFAASYAVPYHPNVTMGWDSWPRVPLDHPFEPGEYPATPMITGNPPAEFQKALAKAHAWLDRAEVSQKILTINAWNEWTEGSYLEPDTQYGMGYLEAIHSVFG